MSLAANPQIVVVGTGPGPISLLTLEAEKELLGADKIFFRMSAHPVYHWLAEGNKQLICFDRLYTIPHLTYREVYEFIVEALIKEANVKGRAIYALPGNPWVFEATTGWLCRGAEAASISVRIIPGMSFLELIYAELALDPAVGVQILMPGALRSPVGGVSNSLGLVIGLVGQTTAPDPQCQQNNVEDLQRWLLERFSPDHAVSLVWTTGLPDYQTCSKTFPLAALVAECGDCEFFASLWVPPT